MVSKRNQHSSTPSTMARISSPPAATSLSGLRRREIILGSAELIKRIRKNQFARIVRVDKMTLAVLEATLKLFFDEEKAANNTSRPCGCCCAPSRTFANRHSTSRAKLRKANLPCVIESVDGFSQTGSGSLPAQNLPTRLITVQSETISSVRCWPIGFASMPCRFFITDSGRQNTP